MSTNKNYCKDSGCIPNCKEKKGFFVLEINQFIEIGMPSNCVQGELSLRYPTEKEAKLFKNIKRTTDWLRIIADSLNKSGRYEEVA